LWNGFYIFMFMTLKQLKQNSMRFSKLIYIAISIGVLSVILSLVVTFFAYNFTVENSIDIYRKSYENKTHLYNSLIETNTELSDLQILRLIDSVSNTAHNKVTDEYICIIDSNCNFVYNSKSPHLVGNNVSENVIYIFDTNQKFNLNEILPLKTDFSGYCVTKGGDTYITTFHAIKSRNWVLSIHRSKMALHNEINEFYKWLKYSFFFLIGILMPFSLIALFLISRYTHRYRINIQKQTQLELRERNEELRVAKQRAEESDSLKSKYLANMSHEIRTPMNGIMGFAGLLENEQLPPEKRKNYVRIINESCRQLLSIINDIIDMSKIEAGVMQIDDTPFCVNEELEKIKLFYTQLAENKGISIFLRTTLSNSESCISSDITKFNQIFNNLISNSLKFTSTGGIIFGYSVEGDFLKFYVNDTGIGIAKELQDVIFQRFKQADLTITHKYGGTGLGLAITKAYVNMLGGEMSLESDKDKGATFTFTIPYKKMETKTLTSNDGVSDFPKYEKYTILIVDDEKINLLYLNELLAKTEAKLLKAQNGLQAVEICESNPNIDIILMDIKMPVMNGYDAMEKIKKMNHNAKIVAQTAFAMLEDREKVMKAGFDGYLNKPINKHQLFDVLDKLTNFTTN